MNILQKTDELGKEFKENAIDMMNLQNGEEGKALTGVTKGVGQILQAPGAELHDIANLAGDGVKLAGDVVGGNDKSNAVNTPLKTNDVKDIKPVMSGPTAAPTAPTQNLNVGGRG